MKSIIITIIPIRKGIVQLLHHSLIERDFNSFDGSEKEKESLFFHWRNDNFDNFLDA